MQQILNYATKVERIQHLYQEQGEVNKTLLNEDFEQLTEKLKEQVAEAEKGEPENIIKEDTSSSNKEETLAKRGKKKQEEKNIKIIEEPESEIDIKV